MPASSLRRHDLVVGMQLWLFGYEMNDTCIAITKSRIFILGSQKKIAFLAGIDADRSGEGKPFALPVTMLTRKKGETPTEHYATIIDAMKGSFAGTKIGLFTGEVGRGCRALSLSPLQPPLSQSLSV